MEDFVDQISYNLRESRDFSEKDCFQQKSVLFERKVAKVCVLLADDIRVHGRGLVPHAQKLDFVSIPSVGQLLRMWLTLIKFAEPEV